MFSDGARTVVLTAAITFLGAAAIQAAELKPETINGWNSFLVQQNEQIKQRASTSDFFWLDRNSNLEQQVRAGTIAVEPMGEHNPLHVPSGLIHHWIGAVFIPNTDIDEVLSVTRDYARYKDFYKPGVVDARLSAKTDLHDDFLVDLANNSVLSRTSLEGSYTTDFFRVSDKRLYSVTITKQVCEIRDPGSDSEKRFPPDRGSGYIWRLLSTARMEEREGGVLLEVEAVALSRDIPMSLRWFVDPIVRRISRDSLEKSLSQTAEAVRAHSDTCITASRIMTGGACTHRSDATHADDSGLRSQKLSRNSIR